MPTPMASDGEKGGPNQRGGSGDLRLSSAVHTLPTPRASDTGTEGRRASEGFRPPLSQVVFEQLPTPTAMDAKASGGSSPSDVTLTDAVVRTELGSRENPRHLLPTPTTSDTNGAGAHGDGGPDLRSTVALLGTPTSRDDLDLLSTGGRIDPPSNGGSESSGE